MHNDPQAATDKFTLSALACWLIIYCVVFLLVNDKVYIPSGQLRLIGLILAAFCFVLFIQEMRNRTQNRVILPEGVAESIKKILDKSITFRLSSSSTDFAERSSLFSRSVTLPAHHEQTFELNPALYQAKLLHEVAHVRFRDCLTVQLYLLIIGLTIIVFAHNTMFSQSTANSGSNISAGGILILSFAFIVLIALVRLLALLRYREYRADRLAYSLLGDTYQHFLKLQTIKSRYVRYSNRISQFASTLTHPSFKKRLAILASSSHIGGGFIVLDGVYWALILFLSFFLMAMGIFVFFYPLMMAGVNTFTQFDRLLLIGAFLISLCAIPVYLYGISKMIYLYLRSTRGYRHGIIFSVTILSTLTIVGCLLVYLDKVSGSNQNLPLPALAWSDYSQFVLFMMSWFGLVFVFNLFVIKLQSLNCHFTVSRFLWSSISFVGCFAWFASHVTDFMRFPTFGVILFVSVGLIVLSVVVDWVFFRRSSSAES